MHKNLSELLDAIKDPKYKVISFDLFDTLIRRKVMAPEHVFWTIAEIFAERVGDRSQVYRFYDARHHAGHLAQHRCRLDGREDSSLREIYETYAAILPEARGRVEELMELEMEEERRVLEPYPFGRVLYEAARAAGKRIVISSDQYLPHEFLSGLLEEFGFRDHEHFLLSGDCGILKTTGSMYEWLPMLLGVERNEIFHLGDNPYVDYEVAVRKGIDAATSPRSDKVGGHDGHTAAAGRQPTLGSYAVARYLHDMADEHVVTAANRVEHDDIDFVGFTFYGPLLTYLAAWVTEPLRQGTIDRLWLLARDAQGLDHVIRRLYPDLADRIDYVYASRRMLVYPTGALSGIEIFRHYELVARANPMVGEFLTRISSEDADFTPVAALFHPLARVNDPRVRPDLVKALDKHCRAIGADVARPGYSNLRAYYREMAKGANRIGLFDLGWRGNLQRAIEHIFEGTGTKFIGFYVGQIFEDEILKPHIDAQSYAFSYNFPQHHFEKVLYNMWVLERIFSGTEPSSVGIRKTDDQWQPVFEKDSPAKAASRTVAARFQASAQRFVNTVILPDPHLKPGPHSVRRGVELMTEFMAHPSPLEATALAHLSWAMNIEDDDKPLVTMPKAKTGKAMSQARSASSWPAGFDVLQSNSDLDLMRAYWRKRDKLDRKFPKVSRFLKRVRLSKRRR